VTDLSAAIEAAKADTELREMLAAIEHERWAHWQRWMHDQCPSSPVTGDRIIPAQLIERWERQIATPYEKLSEREKDSDREQVDRYLSLAIERAVRAAAPHIERATAAELMDLAETAWGIIANAGEGNWDTQTADWREAAARWRSRYHDLLPGVPGGES